MPAEFSTAPRDARPRVSVVIPTAGRGRHQMLLACVRSIAAARAVTVPATPVEVVVVADGGERAEYEALLRDEPEVTVLAQPHAGPATARNRGWRHASGDVVAFIDDDTLVDPQWLGAIVDHFASHADVAGAGGPVQPLRPKNAVSRMMIDMGHLGHREGPFGWRLITANAAFRRSALEAVDGFDERFTLAAGEDFDLCDRIGITGLSLGLMDTAAVRHHHPTTVRAMLASCRRYRAGAMPMHGPRLPQRVLRRVRLIRWIRERRGGRRQLVMLELALTGATFLRRLPRWYRKARRSPAHPSPVLSLRIALLEALWLAEWTRLGI